MAQMLFREVLLSYLAFSLCVLSAVHPCGSLDTTAVWKKSLFILSDRSDFHMIDSLY